MPSLYNTLYMSSLCNTLYMSFLCNTLYMSSLCNTLYISSLCNTLYISSLCNTIDLSLVIQRKNISRYREHQYPVHVYTPVSFSIVRPLSDPSVIQCSPEITHKLVFRKAGSALFQLNIN